MHLQYKHFAVAGTLLGLLAPLSAVAAVPPSVKGLEVMPVDEGVELTWEENTDPSITHYNVYYSTQSIIDHDGEWEDFEPTDGLKNSYVFKDFPAGQKLYAGVTAVNKSGEESEWFEEEVVFTFVGSTAIDDDGPNIELEPATVSEDETQLGDAASDVIMLDEEKEPVFQPVDLSESLQVIQDEATNSGDASDLFRGSLKLLGARALSPTRVSLTFSHFISISDEDAPRAFKILDPEGNALAINTLTIDRADVILETVLQEANRVYQVIVSEPLWGIPNLPLDPISRQVFFRGHTEGTEESIDTEDSAALFPLDVHDVIMTAEQSSDGTYHIKVTWKADDTPAGFVIRQTRDGGRTFSPSSRLPADFGGAELDGVSAGSFGLFIQTFGTQGYVSPGVLVSANLPLNNQGKTPIVARPVAAGTYVPPIDDGPSVPSFPPYAQVIEPLPTSDLPSSGLGIVASLAMAGALAGFRRARRRK